MLSQEFGGVLRSGYYRLTGGALRRVSEVRERYVTQRGSVGTQTGLGFNICVTPTLTFCPCISGGGMDWGLEGAGEN